MAGARVVRRREGQVVQVVRVVRVLGGVLGGVLGTTLLLAACGSGQPPARSAAPPPSYASSSAPSAPSAPSPAAPSAGSPAPFATAAAAPSPSGSGTTSPSSPAAASPSTGSSTAAGELTGTLLSPQQAANQAGVDPAGVVAGLSFRDANGLNTVVLRATETRTGVGLRAEQLVDDDDAASRRVLREVRDDVSDCEVDVTAEFLAESLAVHDDDGDGTGEVVFAYRLACRGDVSAAEQKLLVLEDGDKHILRGYTSTPYEPYQDPTPEPAAERWPAGAYDRALASFRQLAPEF